MPEPAEARVVLAGGQIARVDADDLVLVAGLRWHAMRRGHTWYARHTVHRTGQNPGAVLMHRLLLGITDPNIQVDHRDGDGLNNRRRNLRPCTRDQNHRNARCRSDNASGYKGVGFNRRLNRYFAKIFISRKTVYLGSFETAAEAHNAYRRAAAAGFGEFARYE